MEIRHLRYFVAVAKSLHFGIAAEKLGIATPTLSVQIKQLETELGVQLFKRKSRSIELNEAGHVFLIEAENTLKQAARAIDVGRRAGRGEVGELRIGYVSSALWSGILSRIIINLKDSVPEVNVVIQEDKMDVMPLKVIEGAFDAAFVRGPLIIPEELKSLPVSNDSFCIALSERHPLAMRDTPLSPSELKDYPFILPEQRFGSREVARRGGFKIPEDEISGSLIDVLARVAFGEGISIVPDVLRQSVSLPHVVYRQITPPVIPSGINLIFRKSNVSPLVKRLIQSVDKLLQL